MKKSLTLKLTLYFFIALTVFILLVGIMFGRQFQQKSEARYVERLTSLAVALAENIGESGESQIIFAPDEKMKGMGPHHGMGMGKMRNPEAMTPDERIKNRESMAKERKKAAAKENIIRRIRDLNRISQGEIRIVDANTRTSYVYGNDSVPDKLPAETNELLEKARAGEKGVIRNSSFLLSDSTLTVGVPIMDKNGEVIGALLLRNATNELVSMQKEAFSLLGAALLLGFVITLVLSAVLAKSFVKPLKQMEGFAVDLAKEKYYLRSDIKREDEIGSLAKSLDLLAARLEEIDNEKSRLDKMRKDFLASVSHELKTPITVVRGLIEMMTAGLVTTEDKRQSCLSQMQKNILGLQRLVQDLFELSRLQNADFTFETEELNLIDPLNDAVQSAKQMAKSKSVAVELMVEPSPIILKGDYVRLRQMFLTVLGNAVKFSPERGTVRIGVSQSENSWSISVTDEGAGISEEELPHIFEKFHRQTGEKNNDGTGLGLAIANEIARRHDINIAAGNVKNGGAVFTFSSYLRATPF